MRPRRSVIPPAAHPRSRALMAAVVAVLAMTLSLLLPATATAASAAPAEAVASAGATEAALTPSGLADAGIAKTSLVGFDPGNIISDALFYDGDAMTSAQIQAFLDQKVGACRNGKCLNLANATISSRAKYVSQATGQLVCESVQGGTMKASELIYRMQKACGISAEVILVTLQKEQGLVTSKEPSEWALRAAMGMGCPDGAPCSTVDAGLGMQIANGVEQMKKYKATAFGKQPGRQFIGYHPTASLKCGGTYVDVENYATAALYNYTPYQPNAAALRAGYGLGDTCSSYGNRNFYNYYTDWFGSAQGNPCAVPAESAIGEASGLYVVNVNALNARKAPTTACAEGVVQLSADTLVVRTGTYDEWVRVEVHGSVRWVHRDYLTALADTPAPALDLDDQHHVSALDGAGNVWAYPFSKSGRWGAATQLTSGTSLRQLIEVGDFDGDGRRDLVGVDTGGRAWLYPGAGTSLGEPIRLSVDWSAMTLISAIGDFSGDGVSDVVTVTSTGALLLWRGDGAGDFEPGEQIGRGWAGMDLIAGGSDLDGDGNADLVARATTGRLYLFSGTGGGSWKSSAQIGKGWGGMTMIALPADFTGDGKADLLSRDAGGGLHLYRGTGTGVAYLAQVGQKWNGMTSLVGPGAVVGEPRSEADLPRAGVGDVDGDGAVDLLAVSTAGLRLYRGDGAGRFAGASIVDPAWPVDARAVALGDFDGDGLPDVGRISAGGAFGLLRGGGDSTLTPETTIGRGWGSMRQVVGGMDIDLDGALDVLAVDGSGALRLYRGDGAGGWAPGTGEIVRSDWGRYDVTLNAGDFDGDGVSDLITRDASTGALLLHAGDGDGGWATPRQIGRGWTSLSIVAPGDFDGDGTQDVIGRTSEGALILYSGNGNGGWAGTASIGHGWSAIVQIL